MFCQVELFTCDMENYLNANFGGVKPKNSPEEALRRWRLLCSVVKNRKRRFRFTANLSKRAEAEAMKNTNKEKLRVAHLFSMASFPFIDAGFSASVDYDVPEQVEASGHGIDVSEESLEHRQNSVNIFVNMTLMILAVSFAFLAVRIAAKGWPKGTYFSNIGWEKSVEELEKNSKEVVTRIDDTLHVIQDFDASRKDHQRDIESLKGHLDAYGKDHQCDIASLKEQSDASRKDLQHDIESLKGHLDAYEKDHQRDIASLKEQSDASRKDHQRDIASLKEQSDASRKDLQRDIASLREQLQELSSRIDNSQLTSSPSQEIVENIRLIEDLLYQIIKECKESSVSEWNPSTGLEKIAEGAMNFVIGAYHEVVGTRIEGEVMIAHGAYEWVSSYWKSGKKVEKEEQKCLLQLKQLENILDLVKKPLHVGDGTSLGYDKKRD